MNYKHSYSINSKTKSGGEKKIKIQTLNLKKMYRNYRKII